MASDFVRIISLALILHWSVLCTGKRHRANPPNILLILADDLGYGDTGVPPFVGLGIKTPGLERMASKGTKLTNYHTAAATCTPTRASILTGMYPWRIGIKAVFEYGKPSGPSNRNDWLPPLPTIPMVLREANYSVTHSGKWHLGGMRNDDLDMRLLPEKPEGEPGGRRCPHPGPNQQGFKNYVSVLDGPGSPRQNRLQLKNQLYSQGCTALLQNDKDIGLGIHNITGYLTYCEAEHAIRAMNHSVARNKPFFINLWFHAPHAPLEAIPGYPQYNKKDIRAGTNGKIPTYRTVNVTFPNLGPTWMYRTMVADMDEQIGRILKNIENLGIERNTLVVFTSDNGPEFSAGTTAGLKGKKRSLYEGGIRVPAIVQWVGTVPANTSSDAFAVSTDLFPTFLDAAGVAAPLHVRLDGLSILPQIVPNYFSSGDTATGAVSSPAAAEVIDLDAAIARIRAPSIATPTPARGPPSPPTRHIIDEVRESAGVYRMAMRDRITLWHNDYEGPRRTAAWVYDYKILLNEFDVMSEMYDMKSDKYESTNLIVNFPPTYWTTLNATFYNTTRTMTVFPINPATGKKSKTPIQTQVPIAKPQLKAVTLNMILTDRKNLDVHVWIASHLFKALQDFARFGNKAHEQLMLANPGWSYSPTVNSDYRSDFVTTPKLVHLSTGKVAETIRNKLLLGTSCGASSCSCDVKVARSVPTLPFEAVDPQLAYLNPGKLLNGAKMIGL